ncbi:hypothetical protein LTR91_018630 [Friedmanniomyces endolithicus]|uniref:Pro-apoptotic serine protease NMA111 n=1 Tax=Friedmanniomyces endolithicus TaxID=329885 RepID=A0AAN6FKS3_9PEZI|nr:hypothetical protein LTR35_011550 [Friedmanniomyces endolithicus]KAK0288344.1 hypothetical protein LTS00_009554 [Friedmanniomyces endolithicus]KAK0317932.1 hypothetical protein LTR82_011193 [Friedmanniomyces endolithicus]KAK0921394.1 hypothetical protein LTR57_008850 [Friedmanniomyces endolithicus]KAK0958921.1 hypothetical protein LTS01_021634 [Friedmanniomyces endolithicus]
MRKECLDVFYGKNNFLLDLRGWMDCSYPEKWTPLMIFERWIDAIGNENAGRLRSLNFMGHSFSVHIRVSKQAPQLASKFHTMPSYEDWIEVAPPGYTFELAACRAEQGLRTTLDNIATERAGKPLRVDDINKVGRFVTMLRPFLCTRCDHLNGAYLKSDRMEEFRVPKLHIEMCGICAYTETALPHRLKLCYPTMTTRVTRSRSRDVANLSHASTQPTKSALASQQVAPPNIPGSPDPLRATASGLSSRNRKLLLAKQNKLTDPNGQIPRFIRDRLSQPANDHSHALVNAVSSTLVFAQQEAGTAVCVSSSGLLLTCSHCVAESEDVLDLARFQWLLFADGRVVKATCVGYDGKRDLALLQIVAAQSPPLSDLTTADDTETSAFPAIALAETLPRRNTPLFCIGHPGSEDFEVDRPGVATGYDVLHISEGRHRGLAVGQDVHDNSGIGALKHDCWTYWGHSGAPLINEQGLLVGLHSSWDDSTGMRRGVAWEAVKAFLDEHAAKIAS